MASARPDSRQKGKPMRRREFVTLLGGAAGGPFPAWAQQRAVPVIGYLHSGSPEPNLKRVSAFRKGLGETGYAEGQNVAIEFRWPAREGGRLPATSGRR